MSNSRIPPQDLDSEMALLGAMMMYPAQPISNPEKWTMEEIQSIVSAESFYLPAHQKIFEILANVYNEPSKVMDLMIVSEELRRRNLLDSIGGQSYLIQLAESFADVANAAFYARCIRREQIKRAIIRLATEAMQQGYDPLQEPADIIADFSKSLDLLNRACVLDRLPVRECDLLNSFYHPTEGIQDHIPVALGRLGFILNGGFDRGSLTIIGARPSCGKTSMAVVLSCHASIAEDGCNTLFISVEMTGKQLAARFMAIRTGVSVSAIKSGEIDYEQFEHERARAVEGAKAGKTIYILDQTDEMNNIVAQIKNAVRKHEVGMVIVDYLGLIKIKEKFDRNDLRIGEIVGILKKLSIKEGIAIVLLAQLNRGPEEGGGRSPRVTDLRDSDIIEHHGDVVLLINPTGKIEEQKSGLKNDSVDCEIIVAKHRQGDTGTAKMSYTKSTMIFTAPMVMADTCVVPDGTVPF